MERISILFLEDSIETRGEIWISVTTSTVRQVVFSAVWIGPSSWQKYHVQWLAPKLVGTGLKNPFENNWKWMRFLVWQDHRAVVSQIRPEVRLINSESSRNILQEFFWHFLEDMDFDKLWFQQDSAICHTARETMIVLIDDAINRTEICFKGIS